MHKFKIIVFGPESFLSTLNELQSHLNFSLISNTKDLSGNTKKNVAGLICHENKLENKKLNEIFYSEDCFRILATNKSKIDIKNFDYVLKLPTSIRDLNEIIDTSVAKKQFNKNSSIKIKSYKLNKNEKKLIKFDKFIILTEKEIQLLELFSIKKIAISKNKILSLVWKYSSSADTHTVETHIYRLRKKINDTFNDENFILNNKEGYYL
tara:strand:- start:1451 stop:2077 length:627 start_codon:yes stop_codon:yes gene_type:complete